MAHRPYLVGLVGTGVGPSLTPALHMAEASAQGLDYLYRTIDLNAVGIAPVDGVDAIRRLLATDLGAQVAVTAADLHATIAGARALTQRSVEEELAQPMTDGTGGLERNLDTRYVPPRTELERLLCDLWQDALGIDEVGVDDDFFEAGGNSLVAVQLLGGIRKKTGQRVAMRSLFEASTVATMAAEIERIRTTADGADELPITRLERAS